MALIARGWLGDAGELLSNLYNKPEYEGGAPPHTHTHTRTHTTTNQYHYHHPGGWPQGATTLLHTHASKPSHRQLLPHLG